VRRKAKFFVRRKAKFEAFLLKMNYAVKPAVRCANFVRRKGTNGAQFFAKISAPRCVKIRAP
jgi:hypothetical protein